MGRVGKVTWDLTYLPKHAFRRTRDWVASSDDFLSRDQRYHPMWNAFSVVSTWTLFGWTLTRTTSR